MVIVSPQHRIVPKNVLAIRKLTKKKLTIAQEMSMTSLGLVSLYPLVHLASSSCCHLGCVVVGSRKVPKHVSNKNSEKRKEKKKKHTVAVDIHLLGLFHTLMSA